MAKFYTPGAIEHFVRFRNGSVSYLGTAMVAPEVEARPAFLNVMNDLGGRSVPVDLVADRTQHLITTTLNRFDWATYKAMELSTLGAAGATKDENIFTHGTLTIGAADFELIWVYTLAGTGVIPVDFPRGRRYYSCVIKGARESTVGTRVMELSLVIEANEVFNPTNRTFRLFSENSVDVLTGLPSVD